MQFIILHEKLLIIHDAGLTVSVTCIISVTYSRVGTERKNAVIGFSNTWSFSLNNGKMKTESPQDVTSCCAMYVDNGILYILVTS